MTSSTPFRKRHYQHRRKCRIVQRRCFRLTARVFAQSRRPARRLFYPFFRRWISNWLRPLKEQRQSLHCWLSGLSRLCQEFVVTCDLFLSQNFVQCFAQRINECVDCAFFVFIEAGTHERKRSHLGSTELQEHRPECFFHRPDACRAAQVVAVDLHCDANVVRREPEITTTAFAFTVSVSPDVPATTYAVYHAVADWFRARY